MPLSRREKIEAMLVDEPHDQFLRFGLAQELDKEKRHDESLAEHARLTKDAQPYVPSFFMAAQQLVRLDRVEEARAYLRSGIEVARQQNNFHAAGEMSEFLTSLGER